MIPYGRQTIDQEDINAVVDVLHSDYLTQGPVIEAFEKKVAKRVGAKFSVAVSNGTAALHLACMALNLGPGDVLWTTPISFVASANCALYCGASVDFVDINLDSYNIDVGLLEEKLRSSEKGGWLPKALVVVHFSGLPCDLAAIKKLADRYGFYIIEDASHALGAVYQGNEIGSSLYSDITTFSFHPVKICTTAEGGMVLTNNKALFERVSLLRTHGITKDAEKIGDAYEGGWYYQQVALGFNYRITDIQAALGISQLNKLSSFIQRRREIALAYNQSLQSLPIQLPLMPSDDDSAWHLYVILVNERLALFEHLRNAGIGVNVHYIPIHLQPYYKEKLGFQNGNFPNAEQYYAQALSLPIYPRLKQQEQDYIVNTIESFIL